MNSFDKKYRLDELHIGMTVAASQLSGLAGVCIILGNSRTLPDQPATCDNIGEILYIGDDFPSLDKIKELAKGNEPISTIRTGYLDDEVEWDE